MNFVLVVRALSPQVAASLTFTYTLVTFEPDDVTGVGHPHADEARPAPKRRATDSLFPTQRQTIWSSHLQLPIKINGAQ
jgi:hypothetical protein